MKLVKYGNIDNYTESFMDIAKKMNACLSKKDRLPERELSEIYIAGMPNWLQIEAPSLISLDIIELQNSLRKVEMKFSEIEIKNNSNVNMKQLNINSQYNQISINQINIIFLIRLILNHIHHLIH
ncbi:hypothetical protein A0H76_2903 [Hepatospora eriocheir]|uniref:Uncharacterized protein n=1 Tax=Hepatospora eriocheir TaxID=1081669 RepID=A0A1X0Q5P0_9MICR|nr:hypothetical protein A0H76_2903 [Hepatospora eriocheir]